MPSSTLRSQGEVLGLAQNSTRDGGGGRSGASPTACAAAADLEDALRRRRLACAAHTAVAGLPACASALAGGRSTAFMDQGRDAMRLHMRTASLPSRRARNAEAGRTAHAETDGVQPRLMQRTHSHCTPEPGRPQPLGCALVRPRAARLRAAAEKGCAASGLGRDRMGWELRMWWRRRDRCALPAWRRRHTRRTWSLSWRGCLQITLG
jgi:hypothetical protein